MVLKLLKQKLRHEDAGGHHMQAASLNAVLVARADRTGGDILIRHL